jgi:hypothetical protein
LNEDEREAAGDDGNTTAVHWGLLVVRGATFACTDEYRASRPVLHPETSRNPRVLSPGSGNWSGTTIDHRQEDLRRLDLLGPILEARLDLGAWRVDCRDMP